MKNRIASLTISTLLGVGFAVARPVPGQTAAAPQAQEQAQSASHQKPDPNRQIRVLTKRLNLNADQQGQILSILNDRAQQVQALRADSSLSSQDRHAKMREIREASATKIRALLTADQQQTFDQMQQRAHDRARQHHPNSDQGAGNAS
jgi:protein CpxP